MTQAEVVYQKYFRKLAMCLPMNDIVFIAKLSSYKLLPGDTNYQLEALSTSVEKALYVLNHVIEPALDTYDTSSFDNLLYVMEHCDYDHVRRLACEIKSQIGKSGMCVHIFICIQRI